MKQAYHALSRLYDELMQDVDYNEWADHYIHLMEKGGLEPPNNAHIVLDAASGTGNMSLMLAKKGFSVIAMDISEEMLDVAQEKLRQSGLRIPVVCQDLRALQLHKCVDAIVCACDGVNYLTSESDVQQFFNAAYQTLKPGGLLLFDVSTREKIESELADRQYCGETQDAAYLWFNAYHYRKRLLVMDMVFYFRDGHTDRYIRMEERHMQRAHEEEELQGWLRECGFIRCMTDDAPFHVLRRGHRLHYMAQRD